MDGLEPRLVIGPKHGLGVTAEVRAGHRHDVRLVACHELPDVVSELVVGIGRDVVKLVDCDQPIVEGVRPESAQSRSGRVGVCAYEHLIRRS